MVDPLTEKGGKPKDEEAGLGTGRLDEKATPTSELQTQQVSSKDGMEEGKAGEAPVAEREEDDLEADDDDSDAGTHSDHSHESDDHPISRTSTQQSRTLVIVPRSKRRGLFARFALVPEAERPYDYKNSTKWFITLVVALAGAAAPFGSGVFFRMPPVSHPCLSPVD